MEYFNENKYKDWELQKNISVSDRYYKNGNRRASILDFNDKIKIEEVEENNPYMHFYMYNKKSGLLQLKGQTFYHFPIGISKEYDENGKLIKETDWDKDYPFKVEDLCKLIKEEYSVDLMTTSNVTDKVQYRVDRRYEPSTKQYLYLVVFTYGNPDIEPGDTILPPMKGVYIDGKNGKILYEESHSLNLLNGDKIPSSKTPYPQKGEKEKKTSGAYKTYQGKDYTDSEWKIFEQEQYNEHLRKTGRADLIKPTDTPKTENKNSFLADEDDVKPKKKGFWG